MLELVGVEEKDIKVRVDASPNGDMNILYDDIVVACVTKEHCVIYAAPLGSAAIEYLRGKGVAIENYRVKSITRLGE